MNVFADIVVPYILYFFVYSFLGYIIEIIYCSIVEKKLVSRGFLFGPILPVYGVGMLSVIIATIPVKHDLILTFIVSMVVCSVTEYFTSWILEKVYGIKWWDYSNDTKFNIQGRICLHSSLMFGIGGCLVVKQIQPKVARLVFLLGKYRIAVAIILLALLLIDTLASGFIVSKIKSSVILKFKKGDQTNEIKRLARLMVVKILTGKNAAEKKIKSAQKAVKKKQKDLSKKIKQLGK